MILESSNNSQKIAELIIDNAEFLKNHFKSSLISRQEIDGYIEFIETLVSSNGILYSKMHLEDDFTFEAVANKAKSFIHIFKTTETLERNRIKIDEAFNRLYDSYLKMMDTYPYFIDDSKIPF